MEEKMNLYYIWFCMIMYIILRTVFGERFVPKAGQSASLFAMFVSRWDWYLGSFLAYSSNGTKSAFNKKPSHLWGNCSSRQSFLWLLLTGPFPRPANTTLSGSQQKIPKTKQTKKEANVVQKTTWTKCKMIYFDKFSLLFKFYVNVNSVREGLVIFLSFDCSGSRELESNRN